MKRSKIILGVLILSVMALVLSGCGGGLLSTLPPLEENDTYALGDIGPAGGYIFYDKGSSSDGWRYLEAAPASTEWTEQKWSKNGAYIGGTETGILTGWSNTTAIVTTQGAGSYAAQLCNDLTEGGYDDWFLPSKDELNLMRENLYLDGVGGFADYSYWSSSEDVAYFAWAQHFDVGNQFHTSKNGNHRVRAVRAFRSTTYWVNYNANGATEGTVPYDSYHYEQGETVTVLDNTGNLVKTGWTFAGWNTDADGINGDDYVEDDIFNMPDHDVTLYAKWLAVIDIAVIPGVIKPVTGWVPLTAITEIDQYTGTVSWAPKDNPFLEGIEYTATITLTARAGYTLTGVAENFFTVPGAASDTNLVNSGVVTAVFPAAAAVTTYTVTYDGNDNTGGTVPVDPSSPYNCGATVTVLGNMGNLVKTDETFDGWNTAADGSGIDRMVGLTFVMASDVTLYAKWIPAYALRDIGPAGGYIFYDKGSSSDGWRYLEAAPSDQSTEIQWYNGTFVTTGATGTAIGTGQANTTAIVTIQGAGNYAAQLCNDLTEGGYSDWFLPSKDELNWMRKNLYLEGVGGFAEYSYWSSSEDGAGDAWVQGFGDGDQFNYSKGNTSRVRAVRAF